MSNNWANPQGSSFNAGAASFNPGGNRQGGGYQQQQGGYNQQGGGYQQGYNQGGGYQQQQGGGYQQQQGGYQQQGGGYQQGGYNQGGGYQQQQGGYQQQQQGGGYQQQQRNYQPQPQEQPQAPAPVSPVEPAKLDPKLSIGAKSEPIVMPKKTGGSKKLSLGGKKPDPATAASAPTASEAPAGSKPTSPVVAEAPKEKKATAEERREAVRKELAKKRASGKKFVRDPRPHFSVVFCGHVDAGKSTISGRLMMDNGLVDEREMEKIRKDATANKREGWECAYVFDVSEEERAKGKTHETGAGYFETDERRITILDAPGHKAFVPSMIGGATQAEICVLVISARSDEFEAGFNRSGQTREHVLLCRTCGVKQMICVINKMDDCEWSQDRYNEIVSTLKPFLKSNGYDEGNNTLIIMPIAGLAGTNVNKPFEDKTLCPFYKGPCLMEYVNALTLLDTRKEDDVLSIPLVGAYKDEGKVFIYGKCESGSVVIGDKLQILPTKTEAVVEAIMIENTELDKCYPGDNVHIRVKGVDETDVHGGYMLTSVPTSLRAAEFIQARVMILDVRNILSAGSKMMIHIHTAQEECTVHKILATINRKTGDVIQRDPPYVKSGDTMMVRIELDRPIVVENHTDFDKLARFMLREDGKTVALGIITRVYESTKDQMKN